MRIFSQKINKTLTAIFLGLFLALSASYVSALTLRPMDKNTNAPDSIDVGAVDQVKGNPGNPSGGQISLKKFLAGFVSTDICGSEGDELRDYAFINDLGYMSIGRCAPGSGIALDIKGKTGVMGTIRSLSLAHTEDVKVPLCANSDGKLELCGETLEFNTHQPTNGDSESEIHTLVIPKGVKSIYVYIRGAGGAGYGDGNIDNYRDDGDSSFVRGAGVSLIANGGKGSSNQNVSGIGGENEFTTNTNVDILTDVDGDGGGIPNLSFTGNPALLKSGICNSTTYYVMKGGTGNIGGKGGASYQGSQSTGGTGGLGGIISGSGWGFLTGDPDSQSTGVNCTYVDTTTDDHLSNSLKYFRPGGDGNDGSLGDGGSGFGGRGGPSASTNNQFCTNVYPFYSCKGDISASGGGGGAYLSAKINNISPSSIFYIKVGRGGVPQVNSCSDYECKTKLGGGATSGKGGDGKVIVEFDYNS